MARGYRTRGLPRSGRCAALVVVALAGFAGTAQAAESGGQTSTGVVAGVVEQLPATVAGVQSTVQDTTSGVVGTAQPVVGTVTGTVHGVQEQVSDTSGGLQREVSGTASGVQRAAQPAVEPVARAATSVVETARPQSGGGSDHAGSTGSTGGPVERGAIRSTAARADEEAARFQRVPARGDNLRRPASAAPDHAARHAAQVTMDRFAAARASGPRAPQPVAGVPVQQDPSSPERHAPEAGSAVASVGSASFFFGGLALLVGAFALAGPRLRRRLCIRPALWRPAAFVVALERPG
jgi:hypothetical protein